MHHGSIESFSQMPRFGSPDHGPYSYAYIRFGIRGGPEHHPKSLVGGLHVAIDRQQDLLWSEVAKAKQRMQDEMHAEAARTKREENERAERERLSKLTHRLATSGVPLAEADFMPDNSKASLRTFLDATSRAGVRPPKVTIRRAVDRGFIRRRLMGAGPGMDEREKTVLGWPFVFALGRYNGWNEKGVVVATVGGALFMDDDSTTKIGDWDLALFRASIVTTLAELDVKPPVFRTERAPAE